MIIRLYPENPNERQVRQVVECLRDGGVIIYPTDSVYALGCDLHKIRAFERIAQIKGIRADKANFSIICYDLSNISDYTKPIDNTVYKLMKKTLPGPYTYILNANNQIPKIFQKKKKTIGIRVPDNNIPRDIVRELGNPIVTTSIHDEDEIMEYSVDAELIHERYQNLVDIVIDGGPGGLDPSTVVDCTKGIEVIREGAGEIDAYL